MSIRRTLITNVVILLAVTLSLVTWLVYRTSSDALRDKQRATRELVEVRYIDQRDEQLRNRAEQLARDVQQNFDSDKFHVHSMVHQVSAIALPMHHFGLARFAVLTSIPARYPSPTSFWQSVRAATELRLIDDETDRPDFAHELVQTTADSGTTWVSKSLAGSAMPFEVPHPRREPEFPPRFDTIVLNDGRMVRRVIVKYPVTRFSRIRVPNFAAPRPPSKSESTRPSNPQPSRRPEARQGWSPPTGPDYSLPNFYLHCAWDLKSENPVLMTKLQQRDEQLAAIDAETDLSISRLRASLLWTATGAILVTVLGGWLLVGRGLNPLRRLSDAVSQISARDFRLPIDPRGLPAEVSPVADRLALALGDLQKAFEREKRAAADISHELRTPIAALKTTLDVACRKPRTADQYRETLEDCRAIAGQMNQLVERMLALAWLDAGNEKIRPEQVDLPSLVSGIAAVARPLANCQGLTLQVDVPEHLEVCTDPDKLREVVMNLVHNAIEYNRPGGTIEVAAHARDEGGVTVEVTDSGIGIPAELHDKIFERFFRADPSRNTNSTHAGLGLSIVKEYVDRLGGRLSVESVVGAGSKFRVDLPNAI